MRGGMLCLESPRNMDSDVYRATPYVCGRIWYELLLLQNFTSTEILDLLVNS